MGGKFDLSNFQFHCRVGTWCKEVWFAEPLNSLLLASGLRRLNVSNSPKYEMLASDPTWSNYMVVSIHGDPPNYGWLISWKIPSRNGWTRGTPIHGSLHVCQSQSSPFAPPAEDHRLDGGSSSHCSHCWLLQREKKQYILFNNDVCISMRPSYT